MATPRMRKISVTDAAFRVLNGRKGPGESFYDVIPRVLKVGRVSDLAGVWKDVDPAAIGRMRQDVAEMRRLTDEAFQARMKRMGP